MNATSFPHALRYLADLADMRGARAEAGDWRQAADAIDALGPAESARLVDRVRRGRDEGGLDVTAAARSHLREIALGGADESILAARSTVPRLLRRLLELQAVTSAEAASLSHHGILTLSDLTAALDEDRLTPELGRMLVDRLDRASKALALDIQPIMLGRAWDLIDPLLAAAAMECPGVELLGPSGDVRRVEALVTNITLVGRSHEPSSAVDALCLLPLVEEVLHRGASRAVLVVQRAEIDVHVAPPSEYGTVLFTTTGSREHVRAVRARTGSNRTHAIEAQVYEEAGLRFIPPELREDTGEIAAAESGTLPDPLVAREHIRGDLHMHTTYSDGRDSIEAMVAECVALGYEYIAITDHSESAAASRTLTIDGLTRQRDEIATVQERYPSITILHGIEVDILPTGRLDCPDGVLESLDIVLASLHEQAGHDAATLTRRCLGAVAHPLVTIITHPANRLVGRRGGYPLDFDAIFAAAAETGTVLEIDGAPSHLDLDGAHARAAIEAGVTVSIDSDCHRARSLERQMQLGLGTARRGWVEPRHVLNTRPLDAVRAFIARKRAGRPLE